MTPEPFVHPQQLRGLMEENMAMLAEFRSQLAEARPRLEGVAPEPWEGGAEFHELASALFACCEGVVGIAEEQQAMLARQQETVSQLWDALLEVSRRREAASSVNSGWWNRWLPRGWVLVRRL